MSHCREAQIVLLAWDECADLPENIAVHVGSCQNCRAYFDTLFPPLRAPKLRGQIPAQPMRTLSGRRALAAIAFAALMLLGLLVWGDQRAERSVDLAELIPEECEAEAAVLECPVG